MTSDDEIRPPQNVEELEELRDQIAQLRREDRYAWMSRSGAPNHTLAVLDATIEDAQRQRVVTTTARGYRIEGVPGLFSEPWLIVNALVKLARGSRWDGLLRARGITPRRRNL